MFKKKSKKGELDYIKPFLSSHYQIHNIARLKHLESLHLDLNNKTVFEIGAGIGDHSLFYLYKNCNVVASDGRSELVNFIKNRLGIDCFQLNAETELEKLNNFQTFDIIHCYGILYHLNDPQKLLKTISGIGKTLLLETCVSPDDSNYGLNLINENRDNPTQAISGSGCRPNRKWLFESLKKYFKYVYLPKTQPDHPEFPRDWSNLDQKENTLYRAVFICSHIEIQNHNLVDFLLKKYD